MLFRSGPWLVALGLTLAAFYLLDLRSFRRMPRRLQAEAAQEAETWRVDGAGNVLLLGVIIGAVFLPDRFFLREAVMLAAAVASHRLTPRAVHEANAFSFGPVREVAFLFAGIFATMIPALGYLELHGREFGFTAPLQYYLASGALSSVLDNAPTSTG